MSNRFENVLIVGSKRTGALEFAYTRALSRLGLESVDHFDVELPASSLISNRFVGRLTRRLQDQATGKALFRYLKSRKQKYEAIIVFKGMFLTPSWINRCKALSHPAIWVNLNPDDPFNLTSRGATNRNVFNSIRLFDIYAIWARHLAPAIQRQGCFTALYLPFGYDRDHHFPMDHETEMQDEYFTFVGGWDRDRERVLTAVGDLPIRIYGEGWHRISNGSPLKGKIHPANIYGAELRRVVTGALAAINILRPQNYGAHNMRTFEVPAMKGVMMTTRSAEQQQFFPDGAASFMFDEPGELRQKLKEILDAKHDLNKLRDTAFSLCQGHSYDDRARALYDVIAARWTKRVAA